MPLPAADSTDADLCLKVLLPCSRRCRNGADSEEPDPIQRVAEALELFVLKDHLAEQFTFTAAKTDGVDLTSSVFAWTKHPGSSTPTPNGRSNAHRPSAFECINYSTLWCSVDLPLVLP